MSANRSVQAAQRRRAAPQDGGMPGRGPQPSINSAQLFANQAKPGQGPNIPNGRLAGQQAAMQQKQMQQQSYQLQQTQKVEGIAGVSKMTIAQAITLITLRLGAVESKLMVLEHETPSQGMSYNGLNNMVLIEKDVIESITNRLETLENRSSTPASASASASGPEMTLLKQQFEMLKQSMVQTKGSVVKDNKEMKSQVDNLKKEIDETKELVNVIQNLTMNNSQKIFELSSNIFENIDDGLLGSELLLRDVDYDPLLNISELRCLSNTNDNGEIIEPNLKEIIENEMNGQNI
jgi:hypothetical protein